MILTDTQSVLRDAVRDFAQDKNRPDSAAFEAASAYPDGLFEEFAGLGLMVMTAPESVGSAGAD